MTPIRNQTGTRLDQDTLEGIYAPVALELTETEDLVTRSLASDNATVGEMARHLSKGMGKRVRSALALLAWKACARPGRPSPHRDQALVLAESVELIHTATLVHDDIIDNSPLRRGQKTLNYAWGNEISVLMGDFIFSRVFSGLALGVDPAVTRRVAQATNLLCEGEIQEVRSRYLVTLSEAAYFDTIEKKTAALIALACEAGGMVAGADEGTLRALAAYGFKTGTAFQIADDLLDLESDTATLGKPEGHDLLEGKLTLPAILALARASKSERAGIQEILLEDPIQPAQLERVVQFIRAQGGVEAARERAKSLAAEARGALAALPESPARKSLEDLAEFFVNRKR